MRTALKSAVSAAIALLILVLPSLVAARDVKRCGITIAARKTGRLVKDVRCGWRCANDPTVRCRFDRPDENYGCPLIGGEPYVCDPERIVLEPNATLDLNGFTLTAVDHGVGIVCAPGGHEKCTLKGGTFAAQGAYAFVPNGRDLVLQDLVVKNADGHSNAGRLTATNVVFQDSTATLRGTRGARLRNSKFDGRVESSKDMTLFNTEGVEGFVAAGAIRGSGVTVANGVIGAGSIHLRRSSVAVEGFDPAVFVPALVATHKVILRDSVVGTILSGEKPTLLDGATCTESRKVGVEERWGVCTND